MSSMIHTPSEIEVSKIVFQPVKILDNGGKSVNLHFDGRNIMVETPSLSVPYGINVFDKTSPPKFSVDLSLRGADDNEKVRQLQDFLEAFDERMIDAGVENAGKWFKMANPNREVIKAFYTPVVKISRDASGAPKPYPPTFKVALRKKIAKKGGPAADPNDSSVGAFEVQIYNAAETDSKGQITTFAADSTIESALPKRSQTTAIIQCTGVWFAGGKFGTTWKAVQIRVDSQPEQIRGPAFRSDAPDIRAFVAKKMAAEAPIVTASGGAGSGAGYGGYDDDEEDVIAAVVAPPKKAAAAAAAPPPAAAFDEEEEEETVSEPIPVPVKKAVKKVIKSAAK
jgi:hypothetical protein